MPRSSRSAAVSKSYKESKRKSRDRSHSSDRRRSRQKRSSSREKQSQRYKSSDYRGSSSRSTNNEHRRKKSRSTSSSSSRSSSGSRTIEVQHKKPQQKAQASAKYFPEKNITLADTVDLPLSTNKLDEINANEFVPQSFTQTSTSKVHSNIVINLASETITVPAVATNLEEDSLLHPNFHDDPARMEKWIKKLFHSRQKLFIE